MIMKKQVYLFKSLVKSRKLNFLLTFSFPLLNAQAETCNEECPQSTKITFRGFSSGLGRSCLYIP